MKKGNLLAKIIIGALLIGVVGAGLGLAQLYTTIYWIDGTVQAPAGETPSVDDRIIVFYETTPEAGYAMGISGPNGLSGTSGEFILNAHEDWRLLVTPGTYKVAIVTGADNYGMNPKDVTVTGNGFDSAGALVLAYGEGISSPEARALPPNLASEIPAIERIRFDGKLYQKGLVERGKQTVISEQPEISVRVTSGIFGIDTSSLAIILDQGTANEETYNITSSHITSTVGSPLPTELEYTIDFANEGETIIDGEHELRFTASNSIGTTIEVADVTVDSGPAKLIGTPLTYPSPLRLTQHTQVIFQYGISKDRNIDLHVFDLTGRKVKLIRCNAGTPGGIAGGDANPNQVAWNLITDQGTKIGSGIYIWYIIDRDDNRTLGKGKLAIAP